MRQEETIKLKRQYGVIYCTEISGASYVWRLLNKAEYRMIDEMDCEEADKEDIVCQLCLISPKYLDYDKGPGGIATALTAQILYYSGFNEEHSAELLAWHQEELSTLECQMETIIKEAFPNLTLEEIESWDVPKTLKYYARASWILEVLRGVPLSQIMAQINSQEEEGLVSGDISDFPELMQQHQPVARRPK